MEAAGRLILALIETIHNKFMKSYQERFEQAFAYWIEKGAPGPAARDLANDQIDFEDDAEMPLMGGSNDSAPIGSHI